MVSGDRAGGTAIDSLGPPPGLRERWAELAHASANIFSTPEWAETWWAQFGAGGEPVLSLARDGSGRELAVLPLYRRRRGGLRLLRFIGHGVGDELGPVCEPTDLAPALRALREAAAGGDLLLAERLAAGERDHSPLAGTLLRAESSPLIDLEGEGGWDGWLSARSAHFRQHVRRRARWLARELGLRYRLSAEPSALERDLDTLFSLHGARWGGRSAAFAGARERFHREFAQLALQRGWLRLWLAESDGRAVAAWYGFRFAGVESSYQFGRDTSLDRYGVGVAMLEHSIREAAGDGMREYRLLRGDEQYKERYATRDPQVRTLAVPGSVLGRSALATVAELAARPRGRELLKRALGDG